MIEIELPDGTILEAPDGADPSAIAKAYLAKQKAAPPPTPSDDGLGLVGNIAGTLSRGAVAGFGDEISAVGDTLLAKLIGQDGGMSALDLYRHYQQLGDRSVDEFAARNPFTAGTLEGGGGVLTGVAGAGTKLGAKVTQAATEAGTSLLKRAGIAGLGGGATGGIQGIGNADPGQISEGALEGTGTGVLAGTLFSGGVEAASPIAQKLKGPLSSALEWLAENTGARALMDNAAPISRAAPAAPAPPVPPEPKLTPEKAKILQAIERDKLTPAQVNDALAADRALGKPVGIVDAAGDNVRGLGRAAVTLPGQGRQTAVAALDDRNAGKAPRIIADAEAGLGQPVVNADQLGQSMQASRAAKAQHDYDESLMGMELNPTLELMEKLESAPVYREAWQGVASGLERAGRPVAPLFDDNGMLLRAPTVNDIDWIKRGLDGEVYVAGGRAVDRAASYQKQALNELEGRRQELLDVVDPLAPKYKVARDNFSNATERMRALEVGQSFGQVGSREFEAEFKKLTPAQREIARTGALDAIRLRVLQSADKDRPNVAAAIFGSGRGLKKESIELLFRTPEEFERFAQQMQAELRMHKTDQFVLGGSQTANKTAEAEDALLSPERAAHAGISMAGGNVRTGAMELLHEVGTNLVSRWRSGITEGTRSKVADELFNFSDADRARDFLRELEEIRKLREINMRSRRSTTAAGAAFLGGTVGE